MRREKAEPVQGRARGGAAVASLLAGRRPPAMQRCPYTTSVARPGSARTPPLRRESAPTPHARDSLFGAVPGTPTEARAPPEAPAETRLPPFAQARLRNS